MKRHLDLLPPDFRRRLLLRRAFVRWCWIAGAALAPLLAACAFEYVGMLDDRRAVENRLRRYRDVTDLQEEIRQSHREAAALRSQTEGLRVPDGGAGPLAVIGLVSRAAAEASEAVQVRQLTMSTAGTTAAATAPRTGPKAAPPAAAAPTTASVGGIGLDDAAVARFVDGLRTAGGAVELKSSSAQVVDGVPVRSFRIECVLKGPGR